MFQDQKLPEDDLEDLCGVASALLSENQVKMTKVKKEVTSISSVEI